MERAAFSYTSIKDHVTPEQIADQILFMYSPRGQTISGQAISICGDTQMLGPMTDGLKGWFATHGKSRAPENSPSNCSAIPLAVSDGSLMPEAAG